jgi:MT0933-like antitoxin protein
LSGSAAHRVGVITVERLKHMGMFDNIKDKAQDLVDSQGDKVGEGLDKAGDFVDDKTGGKYSEQIDQGADRAKDALDGLDGQDDDIS